MEIKKKLNKLVRTGAFTVEVFTIALLCAHLGPLLEFLNMLRRYPTATLIFSSITVAILYWCAVSIMLQHSVACLHLTTMLYCMAYEIMAVGFALSKVVEKYSDVLCNNADPKGIEIGILWNSTIGSSPLWLNLFKPLEKNKPGRHPAKSSELGGSQPLNIQDSKRGRSSGERSEEYGGGAFYWGYGSR